MDRTFLQSLSNLTGLPMAQLLEKLGRIDVVDNPFEKADPERVPQRRVGNGLSAGAANGGPLRSTTPVRSNAMTGSGNGLSAGAANGGPLPSTTPVRSNAMTGSGNGLSAGAADGGPLPSTTANPAGAAAAAPKGGGGSQAYQLGGIKEGFWGGVNQLAAANNISNPNQLSVGQQLKMPDGSSYTVRSGDTLSGIYQNRASISAAPAPAAPAPAAPADSAAPAAVADSAAAAPRTIGRVGANQGSATKDPFAAGGGNTGPGFAQNRRDPNAPAVTAPPSNTGRIGVGGEQLQPGLDGYQAAVPPRIPASVSPLSDPMLNGERRQGNQFIVNSPYEETASPPPEVASPRPGTSVYPPGTSEKTNGLLPDANPYPYGQNTRYSRTSTDKPTNRSEFKPSASNTARQAAASQAFVQESQRMAPPDLTRSMKKKGSWFSSSTHPVIRGY